MFKIIQQKISNEQTTVHVVQNVVIRGHETNEQNRFWYFECPNGHVVQKQQQQ